MTMNLYLVQHGEAKREEEDPARRLGYAEVHPLDLGDGRLAEKEATSALEALHDSMRPDLVYAPEPVHSFYLHPDHLAAGRAALSAFQGRAEMRLYHTRRPDLRVDITAVFADKRAALKMHRSQRLLLEAGRLMTYIHPAWAGVRGKVEGFRSVPRT